LIILELRPKHDFLVLLQAAGIARSTYYYYIKRSKVTDKYLAIKTAITQLSVSHKGRYGYRRMLYALKKMDYIINHKTVLRLMNELGLKSIVRVKKYKSYKGEQGKIVSNIIQRDFKADQPFQKWATDVTEFSVAGQKLYFSPIIELFNGQIVSYSLSERPNFKQITDMLDKALNTIPKNTSLILHSDQGWQYQMKQYQNILNKKGITQSMSRKGNCLDNAIIENFFGTIKSEMFYLKKYVSLKDLQNDIIEYVEYYNNDRIRLNLKGMSPIQYRAHVLNN
jgi:putative transposase